MEDITRGAKSENLVAFGIACNEAIAQKPKPTRSQRRRLEAFRPRIESILNDPKLGKIAENRLAVLDAMMDYAVTGSELSLKRAIKLHQEGDDLINSGQHNRQ